MLILIPILLFKLFLKEIDPQCIIETAWGETVICLQPDFVGEVPPPPQVDGKKKKKKLE